MRNALSWIGIAALFAVLATPLIVTPHLWFPFITGKAFWLRAWVSVAFTLMLLAASFDNRAFRLTPPEIALLALLAVMAVADGRAADMRAAYLGTYERMSGWVELAFFTAYVSALGRLAPMRVYIAGALVVSLIVAGFGGWEIVITNADRTYALFGNPSYLSDYAMLTAFLALFLLPRGGLPLQSFCWLVILANGVSIYCGGSRAAMLGLVMGCAVAWLLARGRRWAIACSACALSPLLGATLDLSRAWEPNSLFMRFTTLSSSGESGNVRFVFWHELIVPILHRPMLGYGQEGVASLYFRYATPSLREMTHGVPFDRAHNLILDWLATGGLCGLAAWAGVIVAVAWSVWKSDLAKTEKAALGGLSAAYLANGMFIFDTSATLMPLALVAAVASSERRNVMHRTAHVLHDQTGGGAGQTGQRALVRSAAGRRGVE